jgi:hypothetical protein
MAGTRNADTPEEHPVSATAVDLPGQETVAEIEHPTPRDKPVGQVTHTP